MKEAKRLTKLFIKIGDGLGMKMHVITTRGNEPIGNGIGPSLEAKDVLKVLQQSEDRPKDLEKKSLMLAGIIFEMCGRCKKNKGERFAKNILESGLAMEKMRQIIKSQGGKSSVTPEKIKMAKLSYDYIAKNDCRVKDLNNALVSKTARLAGAPFDPEAGIYLYKKEKDKVKKGEKILTLYANSKDKMKFAKEFLLKNPVVKLV